MVEKIHKQWQDKQNSEIQMRSKARNLLKLMTERPLTIQGLGPMTLDDDDVRLAGDWLNRSSYWYQNDEAEHYHDTFARWNGSKYALSFMSGRVALSAALYALDLKVGDEVILPGYTCVVVPNALKYAGVVPVYCDIELDTYGLNADLIETKITQNTRAILLHHLYGLVCRDYEAIIAIARTHGLKVIEDCAHATGAEYQGLKVGNRGDLAIYSSEQSKVFNTIQGGMVVTNDDELTDRLKTYYDQAPYPSEDWIDKQLCNVILTYYQFKQPQRWWRRALADFRYRHKRLISTTREEEQGIRPSHYGRKMPAPIAALGLNQLNKIDHYNDQRRKTAKRWDYWCEANRYQKPLILSESVPVYLRYPVLVETEKKQDHSWAAEQLNIRIGVWFVSNIHPVKTKLNGVPHADQAVKHCINLPCLLF